MKIHVIESGSKGNSTLIEYGDRILLIDMGVTLTSLVDALNSFRRNLYDIDALLLTHSHYDHTCGIKYLPPLDIFCTKNTYDSPTMNEIFPFESFMINDLKVTPVETSHDGIGVSVGFILEYDNQKIVYITDTGYIPEKTLSYIGNADYYVMESNHNLKKLYQTNRPASLKARIAGDQGHLSNEDSACYMCELIGKNTKEIILAHLSEESNTPELALKAYDKQFKKHHINGVSVRCAMQHQMISGGDK